MHEHPHWGWWWRWAHQRGYQHQGEVWEEVTMAEDRWSWAVNQGALHPSEAHESSIQGGHHPTPGAQTRVHTGARSPVRARVWPFG